jgi:quercetin dioxygenase-like cupin family protein
MPHEGEEFGFVTEGEVVLHLGKKEFPVKAGEAFYYESGKVHFLENVTEKEAVILWVSSPPTF